MTMRLDREEKTPMHRPCMSRLRRRVYMLGTNRSHPNTKATAFMASRHYLRDRRAMRTELNRAPAMAPTRMQPLNTPSAREGSIVMA